MLPKTTVLLVSSDEALIEKVNGVSLGIPNLFVHTFGTVAEAFPSLDQEEVMVILVHLTAHCDEAEVTRLFWAVAAKKRPCATLVLSNEYHDHQAVALLRAGAADYLTLPMDLGKLAFLLDVLTMRARTPALPLPPPPLPPKWATRDPFFYLVAPELVELMEKVRLVVPQDTTLLFTGETGTGKTRLARLVHDLSPRHDHPFFVVDCGALSSNLIESEMFGHVKGAFTGADRDHPGKFSAVGQGTLVLDEINALPIALQSKLLRAVDERAFEPVGSNKIQPLQARLIAISNSLLDQEVLAGRFRADLYYRLNVVGFYLPPLRERRAAVVPLCNKFLAEFAARNRPDMVGFTSEALRALEVYDWPGNIRELRNVIERAVALSPGPEIRLRDLPELIGGGMPLPTSPLLAVPSPAATPCQSSPVSADAISTLSQTREEAEIQRISAALQKHKNNRLRAAAELGLSRMGLYKKLHKYGLINES